MFPNMSGAGFPNNPSQMFGGMSNVGIEKIALITQYVMAMINSGAISPQDMGSFDVLEYEDDERAGMTLAWKKAVNSNSNSSSTVDIKEE
jgi:hypothetical protein